MKKLIYVAFVLVSFNFVCAQTIYESFPSSKLEAERQLKIQLPRNYEENTEKTYPLFIVLDGDYLFEAVAGNVDYNAYWEDMPEAIVVGVNQLDSRLDDCLYSDQNFLPVESGADFFEFLGLELIPYLNETYRTANFRAIVGHGETANFLNYYLFKDNPLFQAYISISPDLAPEMETRVTERLLQFETKLFYYLATSDNDLSRIRKGADILNTNLSSIENPKLQYGFNKFEGPTHYSIVPHAIPNALESIFYVFQPISKKEYKEKILSYEGSPVDYLKDKYAMITDLFGLEKKILVNDFKAISAAIEKNEIPEYYQELGKLARRDYPETLLGNYYIARYFEEMGEPKKAYKTYKSAYILDEIAGITKDFMLEMADQLKADFGF
ncbi:MAG: esterase [Bacteroidia bacterium]|nr:esterase [Bacteroidia bacterium]NND10024.1 esterase [Flavobacteriaceae bacterium]MBT8310555.1 esterase [Bacteroidia bacterium]NNK27523.1 esterase [Flavobacteriaceae bacterium]NNL62162.1 esterase [Flavobacteriaceae bacterium]